MADRGGMLEMVNFMKFPMFWSVVFSSQRPWLCKGITANSRTEVQLVGRQPWWSYDLSLHMPKEVHTRDTYGQRDPRQAVAGRAAILRRWLSPSSAGKKHAKKLM